MENPVKWFITTLSGKKIRVKEEPPRSYTRAGRHQLVDHVAIKKRRKKNKIARKQRRVNRLRAKK